jgi:hypothetical protein
MDAHDHLVQCGTKTDQCPNCRLFIQRAVFAYHYENSCADINDIEISNRLNNSPSPSSPRFGDDTTPLLTHEASDFPVRKSKVPSVREHTDEIPSEHYCCCCS